VRDLQTHSGLNSLSSVSYQLSELEKLGYIKRSGGVARGIEILKRSDGSTYADAVDTTAGITESESSVSVPLLGRIAAGPGVLAEQNVESTMSLPREITGFGELFMLTVTGDSMIDANIRDGDLLVVDRSAAPKHGKIVIAAVDGALTVKFLIIKQGRTYLMPANPEYAPIPVNPETGVTIWGVVTSSVREH
jgi:repressor LexA